MTVKKLASSGYENTASMSVPARAVRAGSDGSEIIILQQLDAIGPFDPARRAPASIDGINYYLSINW